MRIGLFGNVYQAQKNAYVAAVMQQLGSLGAEVVIEENFASFISSEMGIDISPYGLFHAPSLSADVAISMGGDGTFLTTASQVGHKQIPILGINTGRLGFLADVSPEAIASALPDLVRGNFMVENRRVIALTKTGTPLQGYPFALNEVALLKHDNSSLIEINTRINGAALANYMADGLIVCTPTGSTGYSLSVGGPIIVPNSGTFCLSPVASHSLSTRPVIVCDDVEISLRVHSRSHNFLISVDGRSESFADNTVITIRRAPYVVKVIRIEHKNFFDTLRDKMMWGADQRI